MSDYKGTYTDNLNLSKDDVDDSYDVGRVNSNSDKIDKFAGEVTAQLKEKMNHSFLINKDFQIWQRGENFNNVDGKYTADRWFSNNSVSGAVQINKVDDGLKMTWSKVATGIISQTLEDVDKNRLVGKKVSCAISVDGVRYTYTTTIATKLTYIDFNLSTKTFATNEQGENTKYFIYLGQSNAPIGTKYIINYVDVIIGETIGNFVPRPYGEELDLCQRYYRNHDVDLALSNFYGYAHSTDGLSITMNFDTPMRVTPTFTLKDNNIRCNCNGEVITLSSFSKHISPYGLGTIYLIQANKSLVVGQMYSLAGTFDSEIY